MAISLLVCEQGDAGFMQALCTSLSGRNVNAPTPTQPIVIIQIKLVRIDAWINGWCVAAYSIQKPQYLEGRSNSGSVVCRSSVQMAASERLWLSQDKCHACIALLIRAH
jgi:hypothetical protein